MKLLCTRVSAIACLFFCLHVANAFGQSAPQISRIEQDPLSAGGASCFDGSGFGTSQDTSTVTVNGVVAPVAWWTDTRVCITVPSNTVPGTAGLQVITSSGSSNVLNFTVTGQPAISGISPASGLAGTQITITGTNFGAQQYATSYVTFNSNNLPVVSWSDTQIVATIPSGTSPMSSILRVVVTDRNTTASFTVIVLAHPSISDISPTSGPIGTPLTITGSTFGPRQESAKL